MHLPHYLHDQLFSVQLLSVECRQLVMEVQCWTVERQSKLESVSPSLPEAHQDAGKADADELLPAVPLILGALWIR